MIPENGSSPSLVHQPGTNIPASFVVVPPITLEDFVWILPNSPTYFRAGYLATCSGILLMIWLMQPLHFWRYHGQNFSD
jgi:hypothetical protein